MIKINSIKIINVGPIKEIVLNFDKSFNIICGENGIGKTTILNCLAQSFSNNHLSLKKKASSEKGFWQIDVNINDKKIENEITIDAFHPNEYKSTNKFYFYENSIDVIVFKTHRDIEYMRLNSLSTDPIKSIGNFAQETLSGSLSADLKNWFVNRYLFSAQKGTLDENQIKNFEIAKKCFTFLNPRISFSKVIPDSFDILIHDEKEEIYFEYLSSGYKSCIALLLGLIKEVEFRYKNPSKFIRDFDGIVFIDELDLHLHPEWQAMIYKTLKVILPNAQIFTSTHSPHIIQIANPEEIIALTLNENKEITFNPIFNSEFGCQGWTVEEILVGVMGMTETRTDQYLEIIEKFNLAIESEDYLSAKSNYNILDRMLHPENSLKKIFRIQLAGMSKNDKD
ncbi:recombinase RecF [Leptospira bourretii]|uniref:AAA family ATPase n=1 Tax=Leptospira bourretii TaxID=2484962 RepID=UPI001091354D|nr:AAA family ATPase [Leptospira bourretii]TGL19758.1 recombinase RecF [Leptospira bourretii]